MLIQSSIRTQPMQRRSLQAATAESPAIQDSFTFGSDTGHLAETVGHGLMGAVPVFGAGVNLMSLALTGPSTGAVVVGGAVANGLGTLSLAGGLIFGNSTASLVGTGLLGVSALTAGWAAYQDK